MANRSAADVVNKIKASSYADQFRKAFGRDVFGDPDAAFRKALDELQAFARERLAVYKMPRALRLLPELPLNAMGKVLKKQLLP